MVRESGIMARERLDGGIMRKRKIARFFIPALLCLLLLCGFRAEASAEKENGTRLSVHAFSLGKADAILLYCKDGAVLIDCGLDGQGKEILDYLTVKGIEKLDALIVTHFDKDHIGGAPKVLKKIPIGEVYQSNCPKDSDEYRKYIRALDQRALTPVTVREKISFTVGETEFTIIPPEQEVYQTDESNNSSLVTAVRCGETGMLFTGDCEGERLLELIRQDPGQYDLLQIPHHGKWQAHLPALLQVTKPSYALITSSEEEPEDYMTRYTLMNAEIDTLLTRLGSVDLSVGRNGLSLS